MAATTAATNGQWEVVGKNPKKAKNKKELSNGKLTKSQVKAFIQSMPKIDDLPPLKETPTIFDAFLEKENRADLQQKQQAKINKMNVNNNNDSKKAAIKKKSQEKKKEPVPQPPQSLEEALSKVNVDELHQLVETVQLRFPDTAMIWLKDMAAFLNIKLNVNADPVYSGKPFDYPLSVVPRRLHDVMLELFSKCPEAAIQLFFEHSVTNMAQDMAKGLHTQGYRIIIQSLIAKNPALATQNLVKFKDLRNQYQNRQQLCLSILWALGQGGIKDLTSGIRVWLEMMLPLLAMRAYSKYTIDYLDLLFSLHSDVKSCGDILDIREFFPVMDLIFSHGTNLSPTLHKQLLGLYPKLKVVAFGNSPEQVLRNYFPSFLRRLQPSGPELLKNELQTCLVMCLATDKQCYSVWRQLYTKHLYQSSILMQHLTERWNQIGPTLPRKPLQETLGTFKVTNEELRGQGKGSSTEGFQDCVKYTEVLLSKMSVSAMFPWRSLILFFLVSLLSLLAYDVNIHGNFHKSTSGRLLQDAGVVAVCEHAWGRMQIYSTKIFQWSEVNIPYYYSQVADFSRPYLIHFWDKLYDVGIFVAKYCQEVKAYANRIGPQILQWINDQFPGLFSRVSDRAWELTAYLMQLAVTAWTFLVYYTNIIGTWLQENIFTGNLSLDNLYGYTLAAADTAQQYMTSAYQWVGKQVAVAAGAAAR